MAETLERNWYVIHTYSGSENKVKANIEQRIETMGMKDYIFNVVVPVEKEVEFKEGKRTEVTKKVYPGYILVEMVLTDDSWHVVRNTPGVTGFVNTGSNKPTPLPEKEVAAIMRQMGVGQPRSESRCVLKTGQKARVTDGPFANFIGVVEDVDPSRRIVKVALRIFGRETSVELDFNQVEEA